MHELHLAEDILNKIKERASQEKKSDLSRVVVRLGQSRFTHLAELTELLDQIKSGTVADRAKIELVIIPLRSVCSICETPFEPQKMSLSCVACGANEVKIVAGEELEISEIH